MTSVFPSQVGQVLPLHVYSFEVVTTNSTPGTSRVRCPCAISRANGLIARHEEQQVHLSANAAVCVDATDTSPWEGGGVYKVERVDLVVDLCRVGQ